MLGDEVVVTETEDKPLIIVTNQPIHGHNANALPLLVQEIRILVSAIMRTEAVELRVQIHVDERAIRSWCYARLQHAFDRSNGAIRTVISVALDVCRGADIEDIDLTVVRERNILPMTEPSITSQDEELPILNVE